MVGYAILAPPYQRRVHSRYTIHKIVSYGYGAGGFLTLTADLGVGGMKIATSQFLPRNGRFVFLITLGTKTIQAGGRVVHTRLVSMQESVAGIEFTDISTKDRALLQKFLGTMADVEAFGGRQLCTEPDPASPPRDASTSQFLSPGSL